MNYPTVQKNPMILQYEPKPEESAPCKQPSLLQLYL